MLYYYGEALAKSRHQDYGWFTRNVLLPGIEIEKPPLMVYIREGVHYPPEMEGSDYVPGDQACLLCPDCGEYSVHIHNPVYGY
jgi:hypothetical protein